MAMAERDWRTIVLAVLLAAAVATTIAPPLAALSFDVPDDGRFGFEPTRYVEFLRLARFRSFEPGFYVLVVAAFSRFAPATKVRLAAGWFSMVAAAAGLVSVAGQWMIGVRGDQLSGPVGQGTMARGLAHVATLVMLVALLWWGREALRTEPSHESDAPDLA